MEYTSRGSSRKEPSANCTQGTYSIENLGKNLIVNLEAADDLSVNVSTMKDHCKTSSTVREFGKV